MGSQSRKTVAILGAGPAGLVAAKEAIVSGMIPTIFEKQSDLGGIWNPQSGSTWDTLKTNGSVFLIRFGDTNWPQQRNPKMFISCQEFYEYLSEFADKWNIKKHCKFQSKVVKVLPVPSKSNLKGDQGWNVSWVTGKDATLNSETFDAVFIASGVFAHAFTPMDIKGLETFLGKIIHSNYYKTGKDFVDQRVLVIGGSISGTDLAGDVSLHAQKTVHCFRAPFFILGRYVQDSSRNNAKLPLDIVLYHNRSYTEHLHKMPEEDVMLQENSFLLTLCQDQQEYEALRISQEDLDKPINLAVSDIYIDQVRKGKVTPVRQPIEEVQGSKVKFENGETHEVDVILLGTGYDVSSAEIFDQDILDTIGYDQSDRFVPFLMYKGTVHPDLDNLFFIGMYRGAALPVMEQQARWACRLLTNQVEMPCREVLIEGIQIEQKIKEIRPRPPLPHPELFLFADEFAKLNGSLPDIEKLQDEKFTLAEALGVSLNRSDVAALEKYKAEISNHFMNSPILPAHYNLINNPQETLNNMRYFEEFIKTFK